MISVWRTCLHVFWKSSFGWTNTMNQLFLTCKCTDCTFVLRIVSKRLALALFHLKQRKGHTVVRHQRCEQSFWIYSHRLEFPKGVVFSSLKPCLCWQRAKTYIFDNLQLTNEWQGLRTIKTFYWGLHFMLRKSNFVVKQKSKTHFLWDRSVNYVSRLAQYVSPTLTWLQQFLWFRQNE